MILSWGRLAFSTLWDSRTHFRKREHENWWKEEKTGNRTIKPELTFPFSRPRAPIFACLSLTPQSYYLREPETGYRQGDSASTMRKVVLFFETKLSSHTVWTWGEFSRRNDSQRRFSAQQSVATLLRYCLQLLQHCINIVASLQNGLVCHRL